MESTGLQTQLEEMIRQRTVSAEEEYAAKVMNDGITAGGGTTGLQDLLNFKAEDVLLQFQEGIFDLGDGLFIAAIEDFA